MYLIDGKKQARRPVAEKMKLFSLGGREFPQCACSASLESTG